MPERPLAKILLVDDQPNNLVALADILEDLDAELLTELLGGEITVRSVLGEGSTFIVTLPTGSLDGVARVDEPCLPPKTAPPAV